MPHSPINCKNCQSAVNGKFCSNCGQKSNIGTITFKEILHEGWHNLTHTDKGYLQLFWDMVVRPGQTIKNYLSGQRKRYFSPFTFYIVTTSLLILITHKVFDKEDQLFHINNEFGEYIGRGINIVLLFAIPPIALLLWLFFKNKFRSLAEAFVVCLFAFGALNFYLLLSNLFFFVFINLHDKNQDMATGLGYVFMLYIYFDFFKPLKPWLIVKLMILVICFYFLVEVVGKGLLLSYYGVPFNLPSYFN